MKKKKKKEKGGIGQEVLAFLSERTPLAILVQPEGGDDDSLIIGLTVGLVGGLLVVIVVGGFIVAGVAIGLNFWWKRGIGKTINWEGKTAANTSL